jgi:antitoxin FitA
LDVWPISQATCKYPSNMPKMIQLRQVPDALYRALKTRAARAGMPLSDYLLAEIKEIAERPTPAELRERLHRREPVPSPLNTAHMVRKERKSH